MTPTEADRAAARSLMLTTIEQMARVFAAHREALVHVLDAEQKNILLAASLKKADAEAAEYASKIMELEGKLSEANERANRYLPRVGGGGSHYEGCERDHHACALAKLARAAALLRVLGGIHDEKCWCDPDRPLPANYHHWTCREVRELLAALDRSSESSEP